MNDSGLFYVTANYLNGRSKGVLKRCYSEQLSHDLKESHYVSAIHRLTNKGSLKQTNKKKKTAGRV